MTSSAIIALAAALAVALSTIGPAIGQGLTASKAMEAMARSDPTPYRKSKEAHALSINVSEVIWTIVCFFALLFVLKKFLFDPLVRFMEARQASIDEGHEKARQAQQKKDESDAALRESWNERSQEAKQLLAEGKAADDKERAWVLANAQTEVDQALQEAQGRIAREREQAQAEAGEQMPQLVSALAQQLLSGDAGREER